MHGQEPGTVQDYTTANLILILANLLWIFVAIWAFFGFGYVLLLAVALNHAITWIENRKLAYEMRMEQAVQRALLRRSEAGDASRGGGDTA